MLAGNGYACRMDLCITGIREEGAPFVSPESGGHIASHRIRRETEDVNISARAKADSISRVAAYFAGHHISDCYPLCLTVYDHQIEHLCAGMKCHRPCLHLS